MAGRGLGVVSQHPKRPRDPNQLAKLIVDLATGETEEAAGLTALRLPVQHVASDVADVSYASSSACGLLPSVQRIAFT